MPVTAVGRAIAPWSDRQFGLLALGTAGLAALLAAFPSPESTTAKTQSSFQIDPNTAPAEVIQALPRIGPTRAQAWLEARAKRPFRSLADLNRRVSGIGPVTCRLIEPYLKFERASKPGSGRTRPAASAARSRIP